ncbi:MAG: PadR family transcriptional regulator [Pseudonocardiaceae bacterium]
MGEPVRVTNPLLDVLEVLLDAFDDDRRELHGWAIMKAAARSGPTVYGVLDRLEDADWITGRWEDHHPQPNKPRRRFYRLTPTGAVSAVRLVTARRPGTRRPPQQPTEPGLAFTGWLSGLFAGGAR